MRTAKSLQCENDYNKFQALSEGDTPDHLLLSGDTPAIRARTEIRINIFFPILIQTRNKDPQAIKLSENDWSTKDGDVRNKMA